MPVTRKLVFSFRAILRGQGDHPPSLDGRGAQDGATPQPWNSCKQELIAFTAETGRTQRRPVEGQLNRLKMLKRQMYGRAGIELLRARLLPEPAFSGP